MIITRIVLPAIVLAGTFPSPARPPSTPFFDDDLTAPSATLFQFESRFWPNLQHFLYVLGRHRAGAADRLRSAVVEAPSDTTGFGALPAEDRQAWEEVVAYYSTEVSDKDIAFSELIGHSYALADAGSVLPDSGLPAPMERHLERVAPVYRKLWWPRHDHANRAWIAAMDAQLGTHGESIARRIAVAFGTAWPAAPMRVQVVAYATWAGAYMTSDPTLIHMSSLYEHHAGTGGLEQAFHEGGHALTGRVDESLTSLLGAGAGDRVREISHGILFYSAGWATRAQVGTTHVPYAERAGVWRRGVAGRREVLEREWLPWLEGRASFDDALARVVAGWPTQRRD